MPPFYCLGYFWFYSWSQTVLHQLLFDSPSKYTDVHTSWQKTHFSLQAWVLSLNKINKFVQDSVSLVSKQTGSI